MARELGGDVRIVIARPEPVSAVIVLERRGRPSRIVQVPFTATCEGPSLGLRVDLLVDRDPDAVPTRVRLEAIRVERLDGGLSVTTTELGRLPLKALIAQAVQAASEEVYGLGVVGSEAAEALALVRPKSRRGTLHISNDDLKKVAKAARKAGTARIDAVSEEFNVSTTTAWRAIKRAEAAGFDIGQASKQERRQ